MADLSPQQLQDILSASVSPERQDLLREMRARSEALRKTGAEQGPKQAHSLGAGLLQGLGQTLSNVGAQNQYQKSMQQQQQLLDQLVQARAGYAMPGGEEAAPMPTPATPDEAALMQPPTPGGAEMYGHRAMPGVPPIAGGSLGPLAGITGSGTKPNRLPPGLSLQDLPFALG